MKFSLEKISTVEACDTVLASMREKKLKLERRKRKMGESLDTFRKRMNKLIQDSALVQQTLAAFTTAYHALPEGKHKLTMNVNIKRTEVRQVRLALKAYTYNVSSLLVKEYKYHALESQVWAIEQYIAVVQQRRTALREATLCVNPVATLRLPAMPYKAQSHALGDFYAAPAAHLRQQLEESVYSFRALDHGDEIRPMLMGITGQARESELQKLPERRRLLSGK